ncbi:hypothetical protein LY625_08565 [Lysobacter sp. GX 14042]|uniref:hypothetical protein n=1 Tax=Lysobacter sp. GX 14042 TaxID=2907155 RepID=UPI001F261EE2|nr:hypothetical protein [Lysobacter sp. GX 14042]MCE7032664.1 hypothetical protein [Lysobacter sp. GX 14042]
MAKAMIRTAMLCAAIATPAQAARVDYVVDGGVEHDDNARLTAADPVSQRIWRAGLGFLATQESSTVQARLAGRADYRDYQDPMYSDSVEGILSGHLNWVLLPGRLDFTVEDELELQPVDRFAPDSPDNRQQVNVLSLGPNFMFRLGPSVDGRVEVRYIDTDAEVTEEFNSTRHGAALRLARALGSGASLSFNGQWQDVDYDDERAARDHERGDLYARYERDFHRARVAIDAGWSQVDYADGGRHRDPLLRGELGWQAGPRSRLSLVAVRQFSDAAEAALASSESTTTTTIPGTVLVDDARINPAVYAEHRVTAGYHYTGERAALRLEPYAQRIDYLDDAETDEKSRGVLLGFDYRLRPTVELSAWADMQRVEYAAPEMRNNTWRLGMALEKYWTRHWSTSLGYYRYTRENALPGTDVDQNVWYLSVAYRNRPL